MLTVIFTAYGKPIYKFRTSLRQAGFLAGLFFVITRKRPQDLIGFDLSCYTEENSSLIKGGAMYKILIVEDDAVIAGAIKRHIGSWGWQAACVTDFRDVLAAFVEYGPQLVLLDISLPFYNGYHWCEEIRRVSKIPIIFISSAADNLNIVMAMNMGADDFIAKPFDLNVLTAKVQAMLRRSYDFGSGGSLLACRDAILNTADATLSYNGTRIELTKNEYRILEILMESKGRTVSRETLMTLLWQSDSFVDENTLTVNINRLRKKLAESGLADFIITKRGIGYLLED
jgi:two-component system, OmpR family, response regulator protein BraR/BceR